jgi:dihydroorotate dehydrogenase
MYKRVIKPFLFNFHPDHVHAAVVGIGSMLGKSAVSRGLLAKMYVYEHESLEQNILGIRFKNPVGISGGFDKNAKLINTFTAVGFGYCEVGSITRYPYKGNKRPWSVRLPKDRSIIVNYGLKNLGADVVLKNISASHRKLPLIANIAKTNDKSISGEGTIEDYVYTYRVLESSADIININISCPNTGDGVLLCEDTDLLSRLLERLGKEYKDLRSNKPILLKLKPDLSHEALKKITDIVKKHSFIKGYIISNLSKNRTLLSKTPLSEHENYKGGISGEPIRELSTQMIRDVRKLAGREPIIIGCGGIFSAEHAYEKLKAGANLVELVTGLIFEGPGVVKKINTGLVELMKRDGYKNISEISKSWNA